MENLIRVNKEKYATVTQLGISKPIIEGFLSKRAQSSGNNWRTRWFALYPDMLAYYGSKQHDAALPKGTMRLTDAFFVQDGNHGPNSFVISDFDVNYYLDAPTPEEKMFWMHTIARTIRKLVDAAEAKMEAELAAEEEREAAEEEERLRIEAEERARYEEEMAPPELPEDLPPPPLPPKPESSRSMSSTGNYSSSSSSSSSTSLLEEQLVLLKRSMAEMKETHASELEEAQESIRSLTAKASLAAALEVENKSLRDEAEVAATEADRVVQLARKVSENSDLFSLLSSLIHLSLSLCVSLCVSLCLSLCLSVSLCLSSSSSPALNGLD